MSETDIKSKISQFIQDTIRPALQRDGGDIQLVEVIDNKVKVSLRGACAHCPMSTLTIKGFVEEQLKRLVGNDLVVENVR